VYPHLAIEELSALIGWGPIFFKKKRKEKKRKKAGQ
jgi:hypothetical protein